MKAILKLLVGFAVGIAAGLMIAAILIACFTDTTFAEFITKLKSTDFSEMMLAAGVGVLAFLVSQMFLIILHESGHLVCGLLSEYKFVSFRIFNLTFIKIDSRLRIRRYSIAGTGGQCLLTPPDLPLEKIPTGWYNFGGVLFNIVALLAVVPLFFAKLNPFLSECVVIFALTDAMLILLNGIPMKVSGAGNDAYNMLLLRKNPLAKRGFVIALRSNALLQQGVRPKDMPQDWFAVPETINYHDQLEVSIPMMAAGCLTDELRYADARTAYENLNNHKDEIIGLYVKEIACELVFLRLICGDIDGAKELLDENLKRYIKTYRKVMSSKERIQCAIALKLDGNREEATAIYDEVKKRRQNYLLQGEVDSDLAIMSDILTLGAQHGMDIKDIPRRGDLSHPDT